MNHKINHFWAKKKKRINTCTLSIWSLVQKVWIFTFKVLPKYLAATGIAKKWTPTACNTGFGYMTGADAILGTTKGPSHACECCYMCMWKRLFTCFSMSFHLLHCQARADVVAFWSICGRPGIHAWYTARPSSTSSRCFLSSLLNSSVHHSCVVKWDPVVKSI